MSLFDQTKKIIVTCNNRIAHWLEQEVKSLGFQPVHVFKTGLQLNGTIQDCIRLNLNLRTAGQILFSLKEYTATQADELYKHLIDFSWEEFMDADSYFSITSHVNTPAINNNLFANVRVKDAIADRFRKLTGKRPSSGASLTGLVIHLYWKDDKAELFIDTSGETLSKHGYRKIPGKAPMMEALAASVIIAGNWDMHSPFINPMCGSGTLAIEAALMATGRKPGLYRDHYSFMHIKGFHMDDYLNEKRKLEQQINHLNLPKIIATDIRKDAVEISKINAGIAGVQQYIDFGICDFRETKIPDGSGVIYFNPEYGDRLGDESKLEPIYKSMGDFMKKSCSGYTGYIFTGNLNLSKKIGLKPKRRIEFFNGKIDCRLLEYELYAGSRDK